MLCGERDIALSDRLKLATGPQYTPIGWTRQSCLSRRHARPQHDDLVNLG